MPPLCSYVSTFENLVKPIAPSTIPFVRTVISGYFCTFSNLGSFDQQVRFLAVIPRFVAPGAPGETFADRELTVSLVGSPQRDPSGVGNHNVIFDITGGAAQGQTSVGEFQYLGATSCSKIFLSPLYTLCKGATAQFTILPNLGPGPNLIAKDLYEVRGWVAVGRYNNLFADSKLLVTPEQRGTFIPVNISDPINDPVSLSDVSQLNTSLPPGTPSGGAFVDLLAQVNSNSTKVINFAIANGLNQNLLTPFNDVLDPIL